MGRDLLTAAAALLRDAERQSEELARLLDRVSRSVSRTRPAPRDSASASVCESAPDAGAFLGRPPRVAA